jgi:hypothetical protein
MVEPSPNRRGVEEWLGIADRHLAEAEERLSRLEKVALPRLAPHGRARALAEELLATMRRSREVMLAHRRTLGELAGVVDPDPGAAGS